MPGRFFKRSTPLLAFLLASAALHAQSAAPLRPPATPLVAHDPYFSVWSSTDTLTGGQTRHWTGSEQPPTGLVKIDNQVWRFLGAQPRWAEPLAAMKQVSFELTPTRTLYAFEAGGVRLDLAFITPALPHDLELLARPVTYVKWDVRSIDGGSHRVRLYFDASSYLAMNRPEQRPAWSRVRIDDIEALRVGTQGQNVLAKSGDDLRIDWGYFYLALPPGQAGAQLTATTARSRAEYASTLEMPKSDALDVPAQVNRDDLLLAASMDIAAVAETPVTRMLMLAYDDLFSIEYMDRELRPYWRRKRDNAGGLLQSAAREFDKIEQACRRFDEEITRDLVQAGGARYAAVAILAYRQTLAAHKLVAGFDGTPMHFSKENFSNGCIGTVDVIYPAAPFFLLFEPELLKAQLRPVLEYAQSGRWPWPYAPHDLGQYPLANGQVYGGGEVSEDRQMPVEESGNMLILMAALAKVEGNAEFSRPYWPLLQKWAEYLRAKGMDPENQLSTDDFAGHMAHNTNLSLKAIVALASHAYVADRLGQTNVAREYRSEAEAMAARWIKMADDGDHYGLAFDQPGTWSQKYNLVWDKILGLELFPAEVARKEIAYYKTKQKPYGLPLDNREDYTKLDWILWTATLADNTQDFAALVDPVYRFANESSSRVPLTDWYWTTNGTRRGFQARSVVGGVFIKMLADESIWKKWAAR